ncbi:flagellar brake protein [Sporosalibacterium faouarense]|uniref:flagellar brake protein n=1 Tax=Sporosalibacterium faouarense TaxID=516123 RepID=UPI00141D5D52|nr:PilZ domain-containing protein [Sporosalibacterium faouarense]MTI48011.1 hypothetical protein [Bacillota bacterium]
MSINDLPNIGDRLELYNITRSREKKKYISQMLDIIDERNYTISGPLKNRNIVPFYINNIIEVAYYKENKGKYFFEAIVKKVINKNMYKLVVEKTSKIRKIQQRNFYRLDYSLPALKIYKITKDGIEKEIKEECSTENISGGGIGLLSNYSHDKGDLVELKLELDRFVITIHGKIVRIDNANNPQYKYTLGVKFSEIDDTDRERIIKFIFNQQRKLRKKGLI